MTHDERRLLLELAALVSANLRVMRMRQAEAEIDELAKRIADAHPGSMHPQQEGSRR